MNCLGLIININYKDFWKKYFTYNVLDYFIIMTLKIYRFSLSVISFGNSKIMLYMKRNSV